MTNKPIDFVIAWVDGSDPAWLREKNEYLHPGEEFHYDATDTRYRDWDILRYWFRAVEAYAPWVNRIHFVTWGHTPAWMNCSAPKLNIVNHRDYIPDQYLPTFSSHPIELNMHRIPGLSEQFVYFNDDFFLTAPVEPEDFFIQGLPCDSLEESPINLSMRSLMTRVNTNDIIFASQHFTRQACRKAHPDKWYSLRDPHVMVKNLILSLLNDSSFFGLNIHHLPQAYLKQSLEAVWELDPELLDTTCSHRFRDQDDVSQCVFKFWQLLNGRFQPYNKRKNGKWLNLYKHPEQICQAITQQQYKMLCLNDTPETDFDAVQPRLIEAFQSVLPNKSSFEL